MITMTHLSVLGCKFIGVSSNIFHHSMYLFGTTIFSTILLRPFRKYSLILISRSSMFDSSMELKIRRRKIWVIWRTVIVDFLFIDISVTTKQKCLYYSFNLRNRVEEINEKMNEEQYAEC